MLRTRKIIRPLLTLLAGAVAAATLAACGSDDAGDTASGTDAASSKTSASSTGTSTASASDDASAGGTSSAAAGGSTPPGAPGAPPAGGGQAAAPTFVPGQTPNLQPSTMTIKNWQGVDLCSLLTQADMPAAFGDLGGPAQPMDDKGCGFPSTGNAGVLMGILTLADLVGEPEWADPSTVQGYSLGGNDAWIACGAEDQTCISYVMVDSGNAFGVVAGADGMPAADLQANVVGLLQIAFDRLPNA